MSLYQSGTLVHIVAMVSGAPFAATSRLLLSSDTLQTVDILLSKDENWKRRLICTLTFFPLMKSNCQLLQIMPFSMDQSIELRVTFSIGSPTIVLSSNNTKAWAAPRTSIVSLFVSFGSSNALGSEFLPIKILKVLDASNSLHY